MHDQRTIRATINGRNKWVRIWKEGGLDRGMDNCSLCKKFYKGEGSCENCPVAIKTGRYFCRGTPYVSWQAHHESVHNKHKTLYRVRGRCRLCLKYARGEALFLDKLLPEEHRMFTKTGRRKRCQ